MLTRAKYQALEHPSFMMRKSAEMSQEQLFSPDLVSFVHSAVRLPHARLRKIDRQWDGMHDEQAVVIRLLQTDAHLREKVGALRQLIHEKAVLAGKVGEADDSGMLIDEVVMAVFPAARALLLRSALQSSAESEGSKVYAALTSPFRDLLG